jgi:hypothetical protein
MIGGGRVLISFGKLSPSQWILGGIFEATSSPQQEAHRRPQPSRPLIHALVTSLTKTYRQGFCAAAFRTPLISRDGSATTGYRSGTRSQYRCAVGHLRIEFKGQRIAKAASNSIWAAEKNRSLIHAGGWGSVSIALQN